MSIRLIIAAAALGVTAASATAQTAAPASGKEASIPFIRLHGSIQNFEADSDRGVYLQDLSRKWYYATLLGPCTGLPFANRIAVDTRFGGGSLDRTGTLIVDRQRCPLTNLVTSGPPPKKAKKHQG